MRRHVEGDPDGRDRGNRGPAVGRRAWLALLATAFASVVAGCSGSGDGPTTNTPTATPPTGQFPYTANEPEQNVGRARDLTIYNDAKRDHRVSVSITDTETGEEILRRTVTVEGETEKVFEDLIRKQGAFEVGFELGVGIQKTYEWPVDDSHGDAGFTISQGDRPNEPVVWFSITTL